MTTSEDASVTARVEARSGPTIRRALSLAGHPIWAVTGYAAVRRLMSDPRLGMNHEDPDSASWAHESVMVGRPQPSSGNDAEDHRRWRALFSRSFTARRLEAWRPRVTEIVDELLDSVSASPREADLHALVSARLHTLVWAEALGVPTADLDEYEGWVAGTADAQDPERFGPSVMALMQYIPQLIARKIDEPGEDVASDVAAAHRADPEANGLERLCQSTVALNFAGHVPTVFALDHCMATMLSAHGERAAVLADPSLVAPAVEEVLRYTASTTHEGVDAVQGVPRWAATDLEIDGVPIAKGELVMLDQWDANRDESVFGDPHTFDIRRTRNPHLSFGHGIHFCIGAPLARIEMQELLLAILRRFPDMELAVPIDRLTSRFEKITGGYRELPVRW